MLSAKAKGASEPYLVSPETGFEFTVSEGLKGSMGLGTVVKTMKREQKVHLMLQPECEYHEFQSHEAKPRLAIVMASPVRGWLHGTHLHLSNQPILNLRVTNVRLVVADQPQATTPCKRACKASAHYTSTCN